MAFLRKHKKKLLLLLSLLVMVAVVAWFWLPPWLLGRLLTQTKADLAEKNLTLQYAEYRLEDLSNLSITQLSIQPSDGSDTLLSIDSLHVQLDVLSLLRGKLDLQRITLIRPQLHMYDTPERSNMRWREALDEEESESQRDPVARLSKLLRRLDALIPNYARIVDGDFILLTADNNLHCSVSLATLQEGILDFGFRLNGKDYHLGGRLQGVDDMALSFTHGHTGQYWELGKNKHLRFDSLQVAVRACDLGSESVDMRMAVGFANLGVYHPQLNKDTTLFDSVRFDMGLHMTPGTFELDSSSVLALNGVEITPWLLLSKTTGRRVGMALRTEEILIQDLLKALPKGAFENLKGMQAAGQVQLAMDFAYDSTRPDTVIFDLWAKHKGLKVQEWGKAKLSLLNDTFTHRPHYSDRRISLADQNPNYVPLERISKNLQHAVHYSEDGGLFHHNGFNLTAFKEAIIENLNHGRFRRGASTIPMQLVKNVFLGREKTIERKLEEAALVWTMMQLNLVPRERILEVYLNVIEWGPNIYGAREASRFYFEKEPAWLTMEESLFLAMIVPSPRNFVHYLNDTTYHVDGRHEAYYDMMGRVLARKEAITEAEAEKLNMRYVFLRGKARMQAMEYYNKKRQAKASK